MKKSLIAFLTMLVLFSSLAQPVAAQSTPPAESRQAPTRTPDRPAEMTEEVEKEAAPQHTHAQHDAAELAQVAKWFADARTSRGAAQVMAVAWSLMHKLGVEPRDPAAQELYRIYNDTGRQVQPKYTSGYNGGGLCIVNFNSETVLNTFPDQAQTTFAPAPFWQQFCGSAQISVEPTVWDHYHLLYEDATIDCIDTNTGMFGRGEPGNCTPLTDPAQEPRFLGSMGGNEVLRIRVLNGGAIQPFTMHSFVNAGDIPVKFRYKTQGGQWFGWNSMDGNTAWLVSQYVVDVVEVRITHTNTSLDCGPDWEAGAEGGCPVGMDPFFVDDFAITP